MKILLIQKIFVEKYVQLHKQAVAKFDLNSLVSPGLSYSTFEQPVPQEAKVFPNNQCFNLQTETFYLQCYTTDAFVVYAACL